MKRKKILVINPNTSEQMTGEIRQTILAIHQEEYEVEISHPDFGPESLESARDYTVAGYAMLKKYGELETHCDGVLVACFGDPGLYALKEIFSCPVVGIAEATVLTSLLLGYKFALLGASSKAVPMFDNMLQQYGLKERLAGIETIDLNVTEADRNRKETTARLSEAGMRAKRKGAEVLILGCAGMTGLRDAVEKELNIPVLDAVETGYRQLELLLACQTKTSKAGLYASPYQKSFFYE